MATYATKSNESVSPPEANDTLGMSCLATVSPPSKAARVMALDDMVSATFEPEWAIRGRSASARAAAWHTLLFLSADRSPAAAQTLAIHSLQKLKLFTPNVFGFTF